VTKIGGELWIVDHVRALPVAGGWSYELVRRVRRGEMVGGVDLAERDRLVAELFDLGDVYPVPECVGKLMEGLG
jgi:hypothetical protein